MWKPELIRNKIWALVLLGLGVLSTLIDGDATALIFLALFAVPMFFAKENWVF